MWTFRAAAVAAVEIAESDAFCVVLAEEASGDGQRLELSCALSFDEQDMSLGMNTYSISVESGATTYGGITSWTLADGALHIQLAPTAARALGVDEDITLELSLTPEQRQNLEVGLKRVLADRPGGGTGG